MAWIHQYAVLFLCMLPRITIEYQAFKEYGVTTLSNGTFNFVGDSLELFCNITNTTIRENSSLLYFEKNTKVNRMSLPYSETLTTKAIRMQLSNLSIHDDGTYTCILKTFSGEPTVIGSKRIIVDYKPQKVENISCRVYNWESMKCTWDLGVNYKHLQFINVSLTWTIEVPKSSPLFGEQFDCPLLTQTSCFWSISNYSNGHHYYMAVEVSTVFENKILMTQKSRTFRVETQLYVTSGVVTSGTTDDLDVRIVALVEPAPVKNFQASAINSTCVKLYWEHSKHFRPKFFVAESQIAEENTWNQIIVPEYKEKERYFQFLACGLAPFTPYKFRMSVLPYPVETNNPVNQGYRSNWMTALVTTLEDVPGAAPNICNGCFYEFKCSHHESLHCVRLYWQDLDDKDKHGKMTNYKITYASIETRISNSSLLLVTEAKPVTSAIFELPTDSQNFKISITPATSQGFSRNSSFIFLPSVQRRPNAPQGFLVEMDKKNEGKDVVFHLSWEKLDVDAKTGHLYTGVTIVWCHGSRQEAECKGDIQWAEFSADVVAHKLKPEGELYQDSDLLIGVTAEISSGSQSVSSGIYWSTCTYLYNQPPQNAPKNVIESSNYPTNGVIILWDKFECSEEKSFIRNYLVTYCPSQDNDKCTGDEKSQIVPNTAGMVTLENLAEDQRYKVIVTAISSAGNKSSDPILTAAVMSTPTGQDVATIIGIIVGSFIFLLMLISLVALRRHCYNRRIIISNDVLIKPYTKTPEDDSNRMHNGFQNRPLPKTPEDQHLYGSSACMNNHGSEETNDKNSSDSYSEESVTSQSGLLSHVERKKCSPKMSNKSHKKLDSKNSVLKEERNSTKEERPLLNHDSSGKIKNSFNRVHSSEEMEPEIGSAEQPYCTIGCNDYSNEAQNSTEQASKLNTKFSFISKPPSGLDDYHHIALSPSGYTELSEAADSGVLNFSNRITLPLRKHKGEMSECSSVVIELKEIDKLASSVLVCNEDVPNVGQKLVLNTSNSLADISTHQTQSLHLHNPEATIPVNNFSPACLAINKSNDYVPHSQMVCSSSDLLLSNDEKAYSRFAGTPQDQRHSDSPDSFLHFSSSSPPSPCPGDTHITSDLFPSLYCYSTSQPLNESQFCQSNDNSQPESASTAQNHMFNRNGYTTLEALSCPVPVNDQSDFSTDITSAPDEEITYPSSIVSNISSRSIYVDQLQHTGSLNDEDGNVVDDDLNSQNY